MDESTIRETETASPAAGAIEDERAEPAAEANAIDRIKIDFFDESAIGFSITEGDRPQFTLVNRAFAAMHGYAVEELVGEDLKIVLTPEASAKIPAQVQMVSLTGRADFLSDHVRKDGSIFPVLAQITAIRDAAGKVRCRIVGALDRTEQALAEEKLRQSEELNRKIVEALPCGIVQVAADGRIVHANGEAEPYLNLAPDTIPEDLRASWSPHTIREDGSPFPVDRCPVAMCLKTGERQGPLTMGVRKDDGTTRWAIFTAVPFVDPVTGAPGGAIVTFLDVTAQREAEKAVRELEATRRAITDHSPNYIMLVDTDWIIRFINRTAPEVTPEMVLGTKLLDYVPKRFHQAVKDCFERVRETARPDRYEVQYESSDGSIAYFESTVGPVLDEGKVTAFSVIANDVTERHKTVQALAESEKWFRATFEQAAVGISLVDLEGRRIRVNRKLCEITGYSREEMLGQSVLDITHPDDRRADDEMADRMIAGEMERTSFEKRYVHKQGHGVWVNVTISLVRGAEGEPQCFIAVIEDISARKNAEEERRKLEAQMQHAQKLESLGVLAGGIAHDFNNLLTGVLGNASLAAIKLPADSDVRDHLATIESAAKRMAELAQQMLAYSGKGKFVIQKLDLSAMAREMANLLKGSISQSVRLRFDMPDRPVIVEGDATQLRQIALNLITNAAESLEGSDGTIHISTGTGDFDGEAMAGVRVGADMAAGQYHFLEVRDTGCGMNEETLAKMFDPFFTTKFAGRGLGMAAVLGIVRGHKGAALIESEPGRGTVIRIMLPPAAAGELEEDGKPSKPPPPLDRRGLVLIVEDEELVRDGARAMLERFGFEVLTAKDGEEGLATFGVHAHRIAAVLLDLTLPGRDGGEVLEELRRRAPHIPVLLTSGYHESDVRARLGDAHPTLFLQKPFGASELIEKIGAMLGELTAGTESAKS